MTSTPPISNHDLLSPSSAYLSQIPSSSLAPPALHPLRSRSSRHRDPSHSRSRRRKATWKKLLWVKQSYPDNYTDADTFLDALQQNPRFRPYEFWPLVADSTVIVQQICTMIVFVCCFSGIMQERVSPVTVVTWGTVGALMGWVLWDFWVGQEEVMTAAAEKEEEAKGRASEDGEETTPMHSTSNGSTTSFGKEGQGLGLRMTSTNTSSAPSTTVSRKANHSRQSSSGSVRFGAMKDFQRDTPLQSLNLSQPNLSSKLGEPIIPLSSKPAHPTRNQQRLETAKSAVLICGALLGLSPIMKSLTKSTASDSIWAIAFWLMLINVIFFDYGDGVGATFPASLSTNAALMASTVLASRLAVTPSSAQGGTTDAQSTAHVFSLTLFSIEVFGLFPVFRRYLRHISWSGHLSLTMALVMGAGAGVTMVLSGGRWTAAIVGAILGSLITGLAMGVCAWWLIGLQRFKNEIHGPWDPARPVIRRWD